MCGRPQQELVTHPEDESQSEETPAEEPRKQPQGVSFANPDVIRAAYLVAVIAAILGSIPAVGFFCFLWYPAAGFASVYLYRLRTGVYLTPGEGAKMGAIVGLMVFAVSLLVMTVGFIVGGAGADFSQALREAVEQSGQPEELQRSVLQMIENPATLSLMVVIGLVIRLVATLGFTLLGGALGAKILEKED